MPTTPFPLLGTPVSRLGFGTFGLGGVCDRHRRYHRWTGCFCGPKKL